MKIKSIKNIRYLTKGRRGIIYTGLYKGKKIAVKVKNPESKAEGRISNETKFLKALNKKGIGPKLLKSSKSYIVTEFIEGQPVLKAFETLSKTQIKKIIAAILKQCCIMDKLWIAKEEMHRPYKHIIITKQHKPVMIDFERCHYTTKPHNVTQFLQCLRNLEKNDAMKRVIMMAAKGYSEGQSLVEVFNILKKGKL